MSERSGSWMRDHLANERTLMAWTRTSLALVAVGLGIAKLATVLQVATADHPQLADKLADPFWSELIGAALVALGCVTLVFGAIRTWQWAKDVEGEQPNMLALWVFSAVYLAVCVGVGLYIVVA